ncbi:MAG: hypothetical protein GY906_11600 [bacterium]|nr:hypothetical protein [bacterium]
MKRAKMTRTAAGPEGTLKPGDYAPTDMAEAFVEAGAAEWVDVGEDAVVYDGTFEGKSVAAFCEILAICGEDVPRIIEPQRVVAIVKAKLQDAAVAASEDADDGDKIPEDPEPTGAPAQPVPPPTVDPPKETGDDDPAIGDGDGGEDPESETTEGDKTEGEKPKSEKPNPAAKKKSSSKKKKSSKKTTSKKKG